MSDDEAVGDPSSAATSVVGDEPEQPPVARRARAVQFKGPAQLFLIAASDEGRWSGNLPSCDLPGFWEPAPAGELLVVGAVLSRQWHLVAADCQPTDAIHKHMRTTAGRRSQVRHVLGFVDYMVTEAMMFVSPIAAPERRVASRVAGMQSEQAWLTVTEQGEPFNRQDSIGATFQRWKALGARAVPAVAHMSLEAAANALGGRTACLHVAAVGLKMARKALLVPQCPSKAVLRAFRREASAIAHDASAQVSIREPGWVKLMLDPDLVLDWLDCTSFVKQVSHVGDAAAAFSRIFARSSEMSRTQMLTDLERVDPSLLRRARVRLDAVAMLVWRQFWAQMLACDCNTSVYLWCDTSPQKGDEFFASTIDVWDGTSKIRRWLLPCLSLGPSFTDAIGKACGVLWQIWLLTGPSFEHVRSFLWRIKSITTDQGVERKIVDLADLLKDFFFLIDPALDLSGFEHERWLFPNAWAIPGWKHAWDNLLQRGLNCLIWFPLWLSRFRSMVAFLRIPSHVPKLTRHLRGQGLGYLADVLEAQRLPSFADWRWSTLKRCLSAVLPFLDGLIDNFDPALFPGSRSSMVPMITAFGCEAWRRQTDFVMFLATWLVQLQQWGSGCDCHAAQLLAGEDVQCAAKGRRLGTAAVVVETSFREKLLEVSEWTVNTWGFGQHAGLMQLQACVRFVVILGRRKFQWLQRLPYLLVRLGDPGVAAECKRQWLAAPPADHHRVTQRFMAEGSRFAEAIDRIQPDGTGMDELLSREVDALRQSPLDDAVAEGPHARCQRIAKHARRGRWAWVASTLRLQSNLSDVRDVATACDIDIRALWISYTSVLQTRARHAFRRKRMKRNKFEDHLYRMQFAMDPVAPQNAGGGGGGGGGGDGGGDSGSDSGDDDNGPPPRARRGAGQRRAGQRGAAGAGGGGGNGGGGGGDGVSRGPIAGQETELVKLLRQYLAASLEVMTMISLAVEVENGRRHQFFQVLQLQSRDIFVQTVRTAEDLDREPGLYRISVQPFETWSGFAEEGTLEPQEADCYVCQDPKLLDVLSVVGVSEHTRGYIQVWQSRESEIDGCINLHDPQPLCPRMTLGDAAAPALALMDALEQAGYKAVQYQTTHCADGSLLYDRRHALQKRCYLQCVLAAPELHTAGVGEFQSGNANAYYRLLLKTRRLPEPELKAKEYNRLADAASGDVVAGLLARQMPSRAPPPVDPPPSPFDDDIVGDPDDTSQPAEAPAAAEAPAIVVDEPVGGDGALAEFLNTGIHVPREICGQFVRRIKGRYSGPHAFFDRIAVSCSNPLHANCAKSRSLAMGIETFGCDAAEIYLATWLAAAFDMTENAHRNYKPTAQEMREYQESR